MREVGFSHWRHGAVADRKTPRIGAKSPVGAGFPEHREKQHRRFESSDGVGQMGVHPHP